MHHANHPRRTRAPRAATVPPGRLMRVLRPPLVLPLALGLAACGGERPTAAGRVRPEQAVELSLLLVGRRGARQADRGGARSSTPRSTRT